MLLPPPSALEKLFSAFAPVHCHRMRAKQFSCTASWTRRLVAASEWCYVGTSRAMQIPRPTLHAASQSRSSTAVLTWHCTWGWLGYSAPLISPSTKGSCTVSSLEESVMKGAWCLCITLPGVVKIFGEVDGKYISQPTSSPPSSSLVTTWNYCFRAHTETLVLKLHSKHLSNQDLIKIHVSILWIWFRFWARAFAPAVAWGWLARENLWWHTSFSGNPPLQLKNTAELWRKPLPASPWSRRLIAPPALGRIQIVESRP